MHLTGNTGVDIYNRAMEKLASGEKELAGMILGGLGGGILGGLGGAAGHYLNGKMQSATMGDLDPELVQELTPNNGSMIQAALAGALTGGMTGMTGGTIGGGAGTLLGSGLGGLAGGLVGVGMPLPGDMVRDYKAERIRHSGIPASEVTVYNS